MARYTGPKNRLSRREGIDIFGKGNKLRRATLVPGGRIGKRSGKMSDYGRQLRSKQTAKRIYGVLEKQFRNYVKAALIKTGNPIDNLKISLERRLDNVIYRLAWAKTRPSARQIVNHGLVLVNGTKLSIPSYEVKAGDEIGLSAKMKSNPQVEELASENIKIVEWLKKEGFIAKVIRLPEGKEINEPFEVSDIIEFYSR